MPIILVVDSFSSSTMKALVWLLTVTSARAWSSNQRRKFLQKVVTGSASLLGAPLTAKAGEIGQRITQAVTQSDLGIEVRRSVVKGAQVMDAIDGQWEQFSDRFGLGAARSKQPGRPSPKVIPDPQPLNAALAARLLHTADRTFVALTNVPATDLYQQIQSVADTVRPSFRRSGLSESDMITSGPTSAPQFNFASYCHFKAYLDLIMERRINFGPFKPAFERQVGQQVLTMFLPDFRPPLSNKKCDALKSTLVAIEQLNKVFVTEGLIASIDEAAIDEEQVAAFCDSTDDLSWSIALDGDITLGAQILLQEQGFRLYPNFARYAIQTLLDGAGAAAVTVEDYYMDTDYNSDPDKFQVKEVLLNIVLENE